MRLFSKVINKIMVKMKQRNKEEALMQRTNERMYRKTRQKVLLAEKHLELFENDKQLLQTFLCCCLESVFGCFESDPKALKKVVGALLLELSCAPFKPWKEMRPDTTRPDLDLKKLILNLMHALSEESEEKADLFYYYLRAAEKSQNRQKRHE